MNKNPFGEPQLGKRGLYPTLGSAKERNLVVDKLLWLLAYSDGTCDVIDIADRLNMPAKELKSEIEQLVKAGLLEKV
ncbi:MAG: hypothetical protein A3D92_12415 [Bacteroidetes bacterium RIFCSPHIGHO2_02_FULL_44_7]|nr:MAG: hypothetical protein A3D92_12415 [Bacteroidetes bacterium RIFCSPHIGHO2_02_FULL_44_7]